MVAKMLRQGGLWFGEDECFISPASDNPEGFFEHERLVRLNDELLEATGGAWDLPPTRGPVAADDPRVAHLVDRARMTIGELSAHQRWGWKDPRICLTADFWLDLVPELHFIVCVRNPVEVAMSLKRRNQISYALGLSLWGGYYAAFLEGVPSERRLITHYGALVASNDGEAERLLDFAGVPRKDRPTALEAINPELRHQRAQVTLADAGIDPKIIDLYRRLCAESGWIADGELAAEAPVNVNRAVIDLAAAKELTDRQERAMSALERRASVIGEERDGLADRVQELEDERDRLTGQVATLEKRSQLLGEQLAAAESDRTISMFTSMAERVERLEQGVYRLLDRSIVGDRADNPVVRGCRQALYDHVPPHARVLVAGKSDPAYAEVAGRHVTNFPQDGTGRYPGFALANSDALIAHLEGLRCAGNEFLLVPASSRWLLDHYASFGDYLLERYKEIGSDLDFGMLVDLSDRKAPQGERRRGLSPTIDQIATAAGHPVVVLDMTNLDLASRLSGRNVFSPSKSVGGLPYLDSTIDIVLVETDSDLVEPRRVASEAVVRVRPGPMGIPEVDVVESLTKPRVNHDEQLAVMIASESWPLEWGERLANALEGETSAFLATSTTDVLERATFVAYVDEGVLPLPSCFSSALGLLSSDRTIGGVAVKVLGADGSIEAAGTTLFADGSYAGVGSGSFDVAAAWHEYVRETCWGPGLMVCRVDRVRDLITTSGSVPGQHPLWAERIWSAGYRVLYQPAATAVRAVPSTGLNPDAALTAWSSHLHGRPERPLVLDEMAWREVLAGDDVARGVQ